MSDDKHVVAAVDELLDLAPVLVPLLKPSLKGLLHTLMPVIDAAVGALGVLDPFDIRVAGLRDQLGQSREQHLLVLDFSSGEDTFDELHVRLRHRLLPEVEVAEGAVAVPVAHEPHDLAVADVEQSRSVRPHLPDLQSARFPRPL